MNRVQSLLGVEVPNIWAPMTYIARAELAAAVSDAGGMGVIETLTEERRTDLVRVRDLTDRPVGANILVQGWKHDPSIVDTVAAARITYVATSAGDPGLFTARLQDAGITVFHVVGSLRGAQKARDAGVDGLVVEGIEGGGFKGRLSASTMVLSRWSPSRSTSRSSPPAGSATRPRWRPPSCSRRGCPDGDPDARYPGGAGAPELQGRIVGARDDGTVLLDVAGNPTMRVIRNALATSVLVEPPEAALLGRITDLYFEGDMEASVANTGQVSSRITEVLPVAEVVRGMWSDCVAALDAGRARMAR